MKSFFKKSNKTLLIVVAALALIAVSIGGTMAWLTVRSSAITNTFIPGRVPNEVVENFTDGGSTKTGVKIKNTGNVDAYIRVALIPVWRNSDGSGSGLATTGTFSITLLTGSSDGWTDGGDGYYYYKNIVSSVAPNNETTVLVSSCAPVVSGLSDAYKGKHFELQVIAQSIQAGGMGASVDTAKEAFDIALSATTSNPGA